MDVWHWLSGASWRRQRRMGRRDSLRRFVSLLAIGVLLSGTIAACSGGNQRDAKTVELTLLGYSVPKAAHNAIIKKFSEKWKQEHNGQTVVFKQSYGGSGTQTRAILEGLDADIVHLAIGADVEKLVSAGLIQPDWESRMPNRGILAETTAAIVTRPGNPKGIKSFADLARSDVKWVTPNPKTSGGARWNYFAVWNYAKKQGMDDTKATEFVTQAFKNVVVLTRDAREATDAFAKQGQGDALLNYENEIILAKRKGINLDFVIPSTNLSIDTPIAVVDKNVDRNGTRAVAEAYVQFLFTPEAQKEFAKIGFRPLQPIESPVQPTPEPDPNETSPSSEPSEAPAQSPETDPNATTPSPEPSGTPAQSTSEPDPKGNSSFAPVNQMVRIAEYGGWKEAQKVFELGGSFDAIEMAIGQQ